MFEFSGLILAAVLTSALAMQQSTAKDWAAMPPSFVVDFTALLLLGPTRRCSSRPPGAVMQGLTDSQPGHPYRRMLVNAVTVIAATQAAGAIHMGSAARSGQFIWPGQGVPIALALIAYCLVKSASAEIIVPSRHETAGQSIVAEEYPPRLSELLHRGQPRGGTRRGDRSPDVGSRCRWRLSHCISPTARITPT